MLKTYHIEICTKTLSERFSRQALEAIIAANIKQDALRGQIGHPEYHFDDNAFDKGYAYLDEQRQIIQRILVGHANLHLAWAAFGRLTHAAQDFYAHSNYLVLWQESFPDGQLPPPSQVVAMDNDILSHEALRSGHIYLGELFMYVIPPLAHWIIQRLPRDAHAWMNLDYPDRGPLFSYAMEAACQRTIYEYDLLSQSITRTLGQTAWQRFIY
jgi:hypothetical protein